MIKDLFVTCDSDIVMFAGSIAYVPIGTSASSLRANIPPCVQHFGHRYLKTRYTDERESGLVVDRLLVRGNSTI